MYNETLTGLVVEYDKIRSDITKFSSLKLITNMIVEGEEGTVITSILNIQPLMRKSFSHY